ncbi:hypothetical protein [Phenylobacterium aquaticum]|uniref:hypothetical protein n=1 Tax=Phenylobacterium aquaticum TaxID=1763816 RepID=UPI001F5D4816|nr:hypothetical protein [Phenylobacterium aquaticum]MCI3132238.1 hypothetical protein [Phenylobacterium aquaticum]
MTGAAHLAGLWRREVITTPAGDRDDTTRVFWLQSRSWYADIRIKADRPRRPEARGFGDFTEPELIALAETQGFAGELTAADGVCLWRRDLDYQPPAATPDEATYTLDGDVMIEDGLHSDYQEIWRREADSAAPLAAYRLDGDRAGFLILGGSHFLEILDRPAPLPAGATLAAIVSRALAAGDRAAAEAALSMRISYGRFAAGAGEIALSTFPWLERQAWRLDALPWRLIG